MSNEMQISQIVNGLSESFEDDAVIEEMRELKKCIQADPKEFCKDIDTYMYDWALNKDRCPDCAVLLECEIIPENRGECWGTPAYEPVYYPFCPVCGKRY
jgi:hypothetical protein